MQAKERGDSLTGPLNIGLPMNPDYRGAGQPQFRHQRVVLATKSLIIEKMKKDPANRIAYEQALSELDRLEMPAIHEDTAEEELADLPRVKEFERFLGIDVGTANRDYDITVKQYARRKIR